MILEAIAALGAGAVIVVGARAALRRGARIERIDPFTLTDPWRSFVQDAQSASKRFGRIVAGVNEGPLQERLAAIGERVEEGVMASWRIAQSGHHLHKMVLEVGTASTSESVSRMRAKDRETRDRLAELVKNLDEAVARAAEIATGQLNDLDAVASGVDSAVSDLEAMRLAIAEIDNT